MTDDFLSVPCSLAQRHWRGVLRPPPGLGHPDKAFSMDGAFFEGHDEDATERMALWEEQELAVFGWPGCIAEESEHQKSYVACRAEALSWLRYILMKYDAIHVLPHAVTLLDAYVLNVGFPEVTQDCGCWSPQMMGQQYVPPNTVLISLVAVARLTVKMSGMLPDAFSNQFLAIAVISGVLDAAGTAPKSIPELMKLVDQEELQVFSALRGKTWLKTPLDWAIVFLSGFSSRVLQCCSRQELQEWVTKLMNMIPVTPELPPKALGLVACALCLVQSGLMTPPSAWHKFLRSLDVSFCAVAPVHVDQFAQSVGISLNNLLLCVENALMKYCREAFLRHSVEIFAFPEETSKVDNQGHCDLRSVGRWSQMSWPDSQRGSAEVQAPCVPCNDEAAAAEMDEYKEKVVLMIARLPRAADDQDVVHRFQEFNAIDALVVLDKRGISRCYGFLRFQDQESARRAHDACARSQVTMCDAQMRTWVLEAKWASRDIPQPCYTHIHELQVQKVPSRKRSNRMPPTGLRNKA
mmetsp:Transcript_81660/g.141980  ORF Transcript_81660/g.141980 Transcript_81660/m.141980 type:complete len:522 (+) Transcript_81660:81-1646(+)